jgi:threonine/homoserine/homoserine lactone efflux protein
VGMLAPGMLNMTSVKIRLERGRINAVKFAFGASTVVLIQAYAAVFFTKFLKENPDFIRVLQKVAVVIFVLLSIYFYREFRIEKKSRSEFKQKCKDTFVIGLFLSAFNMFAIPFYYGITIFLDNFGWLRLSQNNISLFVIGSAIGTFMLLYTYSNLAKFVQINPKKTSNNLNLGLSLLTLFLAVITLIKLY